MAGTRRSGSSSGNSNSSSSSSSTGNRLVVLVISGIVLLALMSLLMYETHMSTPLRSGAHPLHAPEILGAAIPVSNAPRTNEQFTSRTDHKINESAAIVGVRRKNSPSPDVLDASSRGVVIKDARFRRDDAPMGRLTCNGVDTPSEVIYWRSSPEDDAYVSPATPHLADFSEKYFTFEYDAGGWNNVRLSLECLMVVAHAMGRTVVLPPAQRLYLLSERHKDASSNAFKRVSGLTDFYDVDALRRNRGVHVVSMEEFLAKEAVAGRLKGGLRPPDNDTSLWGKPLWSYIESIADETAHWSGRYFVFPSSASDRVHDIDAIINPNTRSKIETIAHKRKPVLYTKDMQKAKVFHVPGSENHERIVQLFYGFALFADPDMRSFYKRFVRDYMRYRDEIQCLGHELVAAVREDARASGSPSGDYYALHIRRGDFEFKAVKIGADEILRNLQINGTPIIPPGSLVYISTDDPDGVCKGCVHKKTPCSSYPAGSKPVGCPEDPSWKAFVDFGWKIRFLKDYTAKGYLKEANPNLFGMIECIISSRAKAFAGTYYSTFTGFIHRLRGYHGIAEQSYYHSKGHVLDLQLPRSYGHGFVREWRGGWTDDDDIEGNTMVD